MTEAGAIENPPGFVVRTEARKAAFDNGFRVERGEMDGWACYGSTTAHGQVFIAGAGKDGPWYLALDHSGVITELGHSQSNIMGPGLARYEFASLAELYGAITEAWRLGVTLPDAPLVRFETETAGLPRTTEAERLVVERVGQDIFRKALMKYWQGRCPLTGITEPALLRASHIVPWAECKSDAQRLDVHNGLLLSALWDAAFDGGLVSFSDDGTPLFSPQVGDQTRNALKTMEVSPLVGLTNSHCKNLAWHRARFVFRE
ncbi:MAG: HNH endonuclease [Mesorhizobium sp.]|uniref:HNH endonuclease n=1 Tax=Mesorhizobium sp. TaxID=1871066 RepID=UPI0011FF7183|nr:HNH endonuclease signature motif containing protein [Mesorhizobium sp.]TIP26215.1 MAG: HNH endonuclease [Mesorhizobium sp.]